MDHGEELLAEVHAHAVEYSATKDARHVTAAQSIVEDALKTDVTPWTLYPQLRREEMGSLTGEVVSKVSIMIFLQPERYHLNWGALCNFLVLLADNLEKSQSNDEETVKPAANRAFKAATRIFEAGNPAPDPYDIDITLIVIVKKGVLFNRRNRSIPTPSLTLDYGTTLVPTYFDYVFTYGVDNCGLWGLFDAVIPIMETDFAVTALVCMALNLFLGQELEDTDNHILAGLVQARDVVSRLNQIQPAYIRDDSRARVLRKNILFHDGSWEKQRENVTHEGALERFPKWAEFRRTVGD
ncbi:hypothetical protein LY76DRAFT_607637 [Colletotrichum caudatum]|nr:hypothetical protein LY76DRAFT_607637 [Colletotrichum caudatum]